eukprot:11999942-Ditylum_brightwellii.AAC.1
MQCPSEELKQISPLMVPFLSPPVPEAGNLCIFFHGWHDPHDPQCHELFFCGLMNNQVHDITIEVK